MHVRECECGEYRSSSRQQQWRTYVQLYYNTLLCVRFAYISFIRIRVSHSFVRLHESGIGIEIRNSATWCSCVVCVCVWHFIRQHISLHTSSRRIAYRSLYWCIRPSCVIVSPSKFKWPSKRRRRQQRMKKKIRRKSICMRGAEGRDRDSDRIGAKLSVSSDAGKRACFKKKRNWLFASCIERDGQQNTRKG